MKRLFFIFFMALLIFPAVIAGAKNADLAGRWYSSDRVKLMAEIVSYLKEVKAPLVDGKIVALISPHAGLSCSGPVAAYGFKEISQRGIKTVIVLGFSHRSFYDGAAVLTDDEFVTPLGSVKIDKDMAERLIAEDPAIRSFPSGFNGENSVEMQIPFLQMVLKDFKIVPVAMGSQDYKNCEILGNALYNVLKENENALIVASTDMCHYLPYDNANELDFNTIDVIKKFDPVLLYDKNLAENQRLMCGTGVVCATMIASKKLGADTVEILKYANSGDTLGDKKSVVGYLSAAFVKRGKERGMPDAGGGTKEGEKDMLDKEQRKRLLKLVKDSISYYLKNRKPMPVKEDDPVLKAEMGAFVTLHERGQLRGCIGNIIGRGPLYLTVRDMAVEAATRDPRFRPVTLGEMEDIDIEISVLSPMEKIEDPGKIIMGKHGVLVRSGFTSGVYLPQVATETGWKRDEFMNSLCGQKAGMRPDAWKKGECDIYIFTAEIFGKKSE